MKNILILCFLTFCFSINAQEMRVITETFEDNSNRFQLPEFFHKKSSAVIKDGFYEINGTNKEPIIAKLPIDIEKNFRVSIKFIVPNFKKHSFIYIGTNNVFFMLSPKKLSVREFTLSNENKVTSEKQELPIILKKGKKKQIIVELEKKGNTVNLLIDGMEVYSSKNIIFADPSLSFAHLCKILKIDEITVEQPNYE